MPPQVIQPLPGRRAQKRDTFEFDGATCEFDENNAKAYNKWLEKTHAVKGNKDPILIFPCWPYGYKCVRCKDIQVNFK